MLDLEKEYSAYLPDTYKSRSFKKAKILEFDDFNVKFSAESQTGLESKRGVFIFSRLVVMFQEINAIDEPS